MEREFFSIVWPLERVVWEKSISEMRGSEESKGEKEIQMAGEGMMTQWLWGDSIGSFCTLVAAQA